MDKNILTKKNCRFILIFTGLVTLVAGAINFFFLPTIITGQVHFSPPLNERNFLLEPRLESEKKIINFDQLSFIALSKEVFDEINKINVENKESKILDFNNFKARFKASVKISSRVLSLTVKQMDQDSAEKSVSIWAQAFKKIVVKKSLGNIKESLEKLELLALDKKQALIDVKNKILALENSENGSILGLKNRLKILEDSCSRAVNAIDSVNLNTAPFINGAGIDKNLKLLSGFSIKSGSDSSSSPIKDRPSSALQLPSFSFDFDQKQNKEINIKINKEANKETNKGIIRDIANSFKNEISQKAKEILLKKHKIIQALNIEFSKKTIEINQLNKILKNHSDTLDIIMNKINELNIKKALAPSILIQLDQPFSTKKLGFMEKLFSILLSFAGALIMSILIVHISILRESVKKE